MRLTICKKTLAITTCLLAGCMAWGQAAISENQATAKFDAAITYNPVLANVTTPTEFGMQGGSFQMQAKVWRHVSFAADVAGLHQGNVNHTGVSLDLVTAAFGPRYTWAPEHHRVAFFGQVLAGEAHALSGLFPSSTGLNSTGDSFAFQLGGGVDMPLRGHFGVRVFDAQWLRTQFPNGTTNVQNNLRVGTGVVYRIK